ncbi:MAG: dihydroorotate dehydrogenase [Candidatus Scalindua sp.]|nr:dihydroorotate dehydrogenase electron transfer subunit [Planctomycetota bacterium]GJQ58660.1 MAG: dihydroorotate dehydrogenase [Candidatus Scalindua sp.]
MGDTLVRPGQPVMLQIDKIINVASETKTFIFKQKLSYQIGQFLMVWLPGVDEKPFAVSDYGDGFFGFTALARGRFTRLLHSMKVGEFVGIRGPFGRGFSIPDTVANGTGNACVIGGGCGMASLTTLVEKIPHGSVTVLNGATTKSNLLFANRFQDTIFITDDGSIGIRGYPTDRLEELYKERRFSIIYTCGPEIMMFKVYEFCKNTGIPCEASLERYMKCGIGICGQCVCDGKMVCKDGPVFNLQELSTMTDFGRHSLLKSGQRVSVQDYGKWRQV